MSRLFTVTAEVRAVSLSIQDVGHGWVALLHTEPRVGRGKQRALMQMIDRYHVWPGPHKIDNRDAVDELLAQTVLQRRLPGID